MITKSNTSGRELALLGFSGSDDAARAAVAVQIAVHRGPISGVATGRDGRQLLVANHRGDSISIIDTATWRVTGMIPGVNEPFAVATSATGRAYVSTVTPAYDAIQVIDLDTRTVVATHPLALSVSGLAVSPDGRHLYVSRNGPRSADVAVLDTATGQVTAIDIATRPGTTTECVRISPDGNRLYVGVNEPAGGQLVVIDVKDAKRARVISTIESGSTLRDVAVSPDGAFAYLAGCGTDFGAVIDVVNTRRLEVVSTRKVTEVTGLLTGLTLSGDGARAYLVSDDSVTMVCTRTQDVIDSTNVAGQPSCVLESRDGRRLYIADYAGMVTVLPAASGAQPRSEQAALESKRSVDLFVPDLMQYDAALV